MSTDLPFFFALIFFVLDVSWLLAHDVCMYAHKPKGRDMVLCDKSSGKGKEFSACYFTTEHSFWKKVSSAVLTNDNTAIKKKRSVL